MGKRLSSSCALGVLSVCAAVLAAGCTVTNVTLAPQLPLNYEKLGKATGRACSSVVILAGAQQAVPIMAPSRFERAYQAAVKSVSGATALANVTMEEDWYFALFGSVYCTTITGEGIR
jgi:hypothetical protein